MEVTFSSETAKLLEEENIIIGAIYSRIAHLTINLQQGKYTFATLQTSSTNDSLWRLSHNFVDMDQQLDRDSYFLVHSRWNLRSTLLVLPPGFTIKPNIKKLAKAPTTPPESPPESPTLTYTTAPQIPLHTGGGITCWEMIPQAAPRHTRARTESFLE